MYRIALLINLLLIQFNSYAQADSIKKVPYNADFKFKDGVYLSFDQLKNNNPISKSRIISNMDIDDNEFFDVILSKKEFSFYDDLGMKRDIAIKSVWGYSKNGNIYIRMNETFNKISYVGNICHFLANITVYQPNYYDPYYYNPNYYYRSWNSSSQSRSTEMRQFIMDFENGKILDYDEENLEVLFMRDPVLHDEYAALSKKKKEQMKFLYIRKFNERNPLMVPN